MRKPFWRKQSKTWVIKLAGGRIKTLGKDEEGEGKEHPPDRIVKEWHAYEFKNTGTKPGEEGKPKDMRLQELADEYVEALPHPKTKINTRQQLDTFIAYIGNIKVSQIQVHQVLKYLGSKPWSAASKATALERITAAINWAIGVQRLDKAYRLEVPKHLKPRPAKRKILIRGNAQRKLEEQANPPMRAILTGLRLSGARPGELCGAQIENCNLKTGVLLVLNKTRNKTDMEYRPLYLSPEMTRHVKEQIGDRRHGHIYLKLNGQPWTPGFLGHMVWKIKTKLGLPKEVIAYQYRHAWASAAINESDANPALVAKLLGHQDLTMLLRRYFHEDPEAMRRAVRKATKGAIK